MSEWYLAEWAAERVSRIEAEPQPTMSLYSFGGGRRRAAPVERRRRPGVFHHRRSGPEAGTAHGGRPATGESRTVLADSSRTYVIGIDRPALSRVGRRAQLAGARERRHRLVRRAGRLRATSTSRSRRSGEAPDHPGPVDRLRSSSGSTRRPAGFTSRPGPRGRAVTPTTSASIPWGSTARGWRCCRPRTPITRSGRCPVAAEYFVDALLHRERAASGDRAPGARTGRW